MRLFMNETRTFLQNVRTNSQPLKYLSKTYDFFEVKLNFELKLHKKEIVKNETNDFIYIYLIKYRNKQLSELQ